MDLVAVTAFGILYTIATLILLALGLAVIFGMMGVINLAQAEFLMVGAYTVLIVTAHGASVWIGIAVAPVVVGLLGLVIERTIIRFLYGRILDTMLATWGLSLGLVGLVTLVFGPTTEGIATPLGHFTVGEYRLSVYSVFVILMAFAVLGLTYGLFNYTRFGLVARATMRSEEHTSELQSRLHLVCRLLLEKKKMTACESALTEQCCSLPYPATISVTVPPLPTTREATATQCTPPNSMCQDTHKRPVTRVSW